MSDDRATKTADLELRLVDPATNRFRIYGLTECRTLFGELALRIVWGRIGNRRPRERTETFRDADALARRRDELLRLRERHGYVSTTTPRAAAQARAKERAAAAESPAVARARAVDRAILADHGLDTADRLATKLVNAWDKAATALVAYLAARGTVIDRVDASMLGEMFVTATTNGLRVSAQRTQGDRRRQSSKV